MLYHKPLNAVDCRDINSLLENEVSEGRFIDYKECIPSNSDNDKKELLADISSFSNASGGHIVYGIREEAGIPLEVKGVHSPDIDAEILRLENILRDGVSPRIPGIQIRAIPMESSPPVLIVRVPKSWSSPHMVTFKGTSRFYSRNSAGKYQMDVFEIRNAFLLSETGAQRIRNFRSERISRVARADTPFDIGISAKLVLHIIPLVSFELGVAIDLSSINFDPARYRPIEASGVTYQYNFDGLLAYSSNLKTYLQVFRSGIIEAANSLLLDYLDRENIPMFQATLIEEKLLEVIPGYLSILKENAISPPFVIMLSFLGVRGYRLYTQRVRYSHGIDRENLLIPEVMAEDYDVDAGRIMRPIFDAMWNAGGQPKSANFDESGGWRKLD